MTHHVLFVCRSCSVSKHQREHLGHRGGFHLLEQLKQEFETWELDAPFVIREVECLSACNRPCVVALSAPGKTTLMFGDLPPFESAIAIRELCQQYFHSADGIVPRSDRPDLLKKGILARIPPVT
ncbi:MULTISPECIES: DUF1636 domain-containing protein [Leptolyngbya]|uniref:DUF1636 domain-containing protein n=1 Tax=Leptolyngbya TaxID=47251 RepID=UPI001684CB18|nr:DUF1636 domain-containing protein [Leptolyngbya sp. FACHB-1624]MBD1857580.1 DUF1636 domain-containing protein [Leptolyngbya sp. FACHB-1624]